MTTNRPRIIEVGQPHVDTYGTSDLSLAAFLRTQGAHLQGVQRAGQRATFVFDNEDFCLEMAQRWANEEDVNVSAPVFSRELAKLKNLAMRGGF